MNFSPYQWRQNTGYLPNPSVPSPVCTTGYPTFTSPPLQPGYAHHLYYPSSGCVAPVIPPPPPKQEKKKEDEKPKAILPPAKPASTVVSKKSEAGSEKAEEVCTCTTKYSCKGPPKAWTCEGTTTCAPSAPPKSVAPTMASSKTEKTADHSTTSAIAPPPLRPGENYLFPSAANHTMLHIFNKAAPIWLPKYAGQGLAFKMFKVSTNFSVSAVVERVLKKDGEGCEGWCVTEVVEAGEGEWKKGTTVKYGSEKGKGSLGSMGWGAKRGGDEPPVWLVVHKE